MTDEGEPIDEKGRDRWACEQRWLDIALRHYQGIPTGTRRYENKTKEGALPEAQTSSLFRCSTTENEVFYVEASAFEEAAMVARLYAKKNLSGLLEKIEELTDPIVR